MNTLQPPGAPAAPAPAPPPAPPVRGPWAWNSPRVILYGILIVQALLSVTLRNSAHRDEALYLWAGHVQLETWLHGAPPVDAGFASYFSGSPVLYPVYAAAMNNLGGLAAARFLSLVFMLGATVFVAGATKKMFDNPYAGLWAAAFFAFTQSTQMLGNFATFDPMAVFFLALAFWLAVRDYGWTVAGPAASMAVASKYAAALYIPTIAAMAFLMAWPKIKVAFIRAASIGISGMVLGVGYIWATDAIPALQGTTTERNVAIKIARSQLASWSAEWIGLMMVVGLIGAVLFAVTVREHKAIKALGAATLWLTGLLSPLYQIKLQTEVSLNKHVGYGLVFVAPLCGFAVAYLVHRLGKAKLAGVAAGTVLVLVSAFMGHAQAKDIFRQWPNANGLIAAVKPYVKPGGKYFTEVAEILPYYFEDVIAPNTWKNTDYFLYEGKLLPESYTLSINDGYFDMVIIHKYGFDANQKAGAAALNAPATKYEVVDEVDHETIYGKNTYQVWVRKNLYLDVKKKHKERIAQVQHKLQLEKPKATAPKKQKKKTQKQTQGATTE